MLAATLVEVARALRPATRPWWVIGSAAVVLLGGEASPADIDVLIAEEDAGAVLSPNVACPVPAAVGTDAQISGNGFGHAFHVTTDLPVVAYQMLPYGGGAAAATGASLLMPSSAWGTQYTAVSAYDPMPSQIPPIQFAQGPSYNIVAKQDDTHVTIVPNHAILGGNGLSTGAVNTPSASSAGGGSPRPSATPWR